MAITTSGTFNFSPSTGSLILSAYGRIQIRRTAILQEHMDDGQLEANFWLVEAANKGPNLWTVDLQTQALTQGTATYSIPANTVMILDANIVNSAGISRTIEPLSRTDYSQIPNPAQQGQPTSFWFDRLIAPTITFWPTPDGGGPYTLSYYRFRQMQDANYINGQNVEIPYLFLDAFVAGLSYRLSRYYAPAMEAVRKGDAMDAWNTATDQNVEQAPLSIAPQLNQYFR